MAREVLKIENVPLAGEGHKAAFSKAGIRRLINAPGCREPLTGESDLLVDTKEEFALSCEIPDNILRESPGQFLLQFSLFVGRSGIGAKVVPQSKLVLQVEAAPMACVEMVFRECRRLFHLRASKEGQLALCDARSR